MRTFLFIVGLMFAWMGGMMRIAAKTGWHPSSAAIGWLFIVPIFAIPVLVGIVKAFARRRVKDVLLLPQLTRAGFKVSERVDLPRVSLLIDREHSALCVAYATGVLGGGLSHHIYPARRVLGADIEHDMKAQTQVSGTTHSHPDHLRRVLLNDPNASVNHTSLDVSQRFMVTVFRLRILVDDERLNAHRVDFLNLFWAMDVRAWRARRAMTSIQEWQVKIQMLMTGQLPADAVTAQQDRDAADVARLKRERGLA